MYKALDRSPLDEAIYDMNGRESPYSVGSWVSFGCYSDDPEDVKPIKRDPAIIPSLQTLCAPLVKHQLYDLKNTSYWKAENDMAVKMFKIQYRSHVKYNNPYMFVNPCLYDILDMDKFERDYNDYRISKYYEFVNTNIESRKFVFDNIVKNEMRLEKQKKRRQEEKERFYYYLFCL